MTQEQIKNKLLQLHRKENEMNKVLSNLDKQMKDAQKKKNKVAKMISSNMKYRNTLINKL